MTDVTDLEALERYWDALVQNSVGERYRLRAAVGKRRREIREFELLDELNDARLLLNEDATLPNEGDTTLLSVGAADELNPGVDIDGYTITRRLGSGGMGIVYAASQQTLDRQVALKLIRMGMWSTEEQIARFTAEATAAASLHHPGVVAVHDFGQWHGFHYFSMELVDGPTLAQLLKSGPLEHDHAIRLVRQVCDAVHHAHEHGILHRDLKPSNVLIDKDRARISDFGLARVSTNDGDSGLTLSGAMVGTPSYMSPEQALGESKRVTHASDVYSIGAILYESLTGRAPFRAATPVETMRQVVDEIPAAPRVLNPAISRDLETICLKCLEKDPDRRYASARELERELERIELGHPIMARPLGIWGRAWRWCRRQPALAATLALLVVSLLAGTITSSIMWRQSVEHAKEAERRLIAETQAKADAQHYAENATAVTRFFTEDVLGQAGPFVNANRDTKLSEVLDAAASKVDEKFQDRPLIEAAVREAIGKTYMDLGKLDVCQPHLERAVEIYQHELGLDNPQTLAAMHRVGMFFFSTGRFAEAEAQYAKIVKVSNQLLGPDDEQTLSAMGQLAHNMYWQGRYDEAEQLYLNVLARQRRHGADQLPTLQTMNNLAILYSNTKRFKEAEGLLLETLSIQRRVLGSEYPDTLTSLNNLGHLYCAMGEFAKAKPYYDEALGSRRRVLGEHPHTGFSIHNMGMFYWQQGQYEDALPYFREAFQMREKLLGSAHADTRNSLRMLCWTAIELGRGDEGISTSEQVLRTARLFAEDTWEPCFASCLQGAALTEKGDYQAAEPLLLDGFEGLQQKLDQVPPLSREAMRSFAFKQVVRFYKATGNQAQAEAWIDRHAGTSTTATGP